jgi:hypothetical protein
MPGIEALKYGLAGLAALFAVWTALKIKGRAGTPAGERLIREFMILAIALLLLCGLLAVYEGYGLPGGQRQSEMRAALGRMDQIVGTKLDVESQAFAELDAYTKQILDNIFRQLCRDIAQMYSIVSATQPPSCSTRLARPPVDAAT